MFLPWANCELESVRSYQIKTENLLFESVFSMVQWWWKLSYEWPDYKNSIKFKPETQIDTWGLP
jgi:hypothetical protein